MGFLNQLKMVLNPQDQIFIGFDLKKDPSEQLRGKETVEDILKMAIEAEKNSIVFYLGLKDFVPSKAGKDKVEEIIKEEMSHIAVLNRKLPALK